MSEKKGINTTELTLLIVGSTIGSGVFGITSDLATAAAPGPAIIAWIIVGIGVLTLVLSLTNLSQKLCGSCFWSAGRIYFWLGILAFRVAR